MLSLVNFRVYVFEEIKLSFEILADKLQEESQIQKRDTQKNIKNIVLVGKDLKISLRF